jgi:hypothetical protein
MIKINFSITNPWSSKWDAGSAWFGKLFKNKAWEFQIYRSNVVLEAVIEFTIRQDHAGLRLEFGIASWCFTFNIYDTRHWNYTDNCYEVYNEDQYGKPS